MEGGGGEKGKGVRIAGSEVRKKVLAYAELAEKVAAAAVHSSSPGRKCASNGGGSIRRADDNLPLLLGAKDDDNADPDSLGKGGREDRQAKKGMQKEEGGGGSNPKMVHRPQVAEKSRHQFAAEVTAGRLRAPNCRDYSSPPRSASMDGDKTAMEVELAEGNAANAKALIWSFVHKAVEEAHAAKWQGLTDAAAVKTFVKNAVEEAHAAKSEGLTAAVKTFIKNAVEQAHAAKWEENAAAIKRLVQQTVEEAQAAKWEGLTDATAMKSFVQWTVHQAQRERQDFEDVQLQNLITQAVKEAVEESVRKAEHHSSQPAPANGISALDRTKLVKDALVEHAALSRALFAFALGFTIPFLLARRGARPSKEEQPVSDGVVTGMAKEAALTFLIETVCYAYLLFTHFIRTKGPRLSLTGRRITSTLIGCLVTLWLLFYTYCIPEWLFKHWFWYITSVFLVVNGIFTLCIGWFSEYRWIDD